MDEKIKTWTLRFPTKENPNIEKGLFDWPIALQYDVKAKYRLIFHPSVRLTNQKPRAFVSVRQTNQIALFTFVCCFCFVCAFSFLGHMKNALAEAKVHSGDSKDYMYMYRISIESRSYHHIIYSAKRQKQNA